MDRCKSSVTLIKCTAPWQAPVACYIGKGTKSKQTRIINSY